MNIRNICLGVVCGAVLAGCSDKMDYHEYTTYDKDYVFADFGRTAGFVNNIYSYLDEDLPDLYSLSSACDESEMAVTYSSVLDYTDGGWSALNTTSFFNYYVPIRAANFFLEEGVGHTFSDLQYTEDYQAQMTKYNRLQFEVRLLRAYYYFLLVRAYGDVPFTTQVLTEDEANSMGRTPADQVLTFIISECEAVANELPVSYAGLDNDAAGGNTDPETGRVTRGTALALKARAALYRASKLFNDSEDRELWHDAALASQDVIDFCQENGFALGAYDELWGSSNWEASEVIFARRVGTLNWVETNNFPTGMENAMGGNCPTQTLVDAYEMVNGGQPDPDDPYTGRDPRFGMTIAVNGEQWPNSNTGGLETFVGGRNGQPVPYATPTGYYLKKYLDGSLDISSSSGSSGNRHSWIVFRLGEFYLNYAEAAFRYFGSPYASDAELFMTAADAVNTIRQRTGVNMPTLPDGLTNDQFWTRYKNERMVELAFEGHRFWDIRRWKEGGIDSIDRMIITRNDDETFTYTRETKSLVWDDRMYFFPIPDSEIRKNGNLTQNTGW